MNIKVLCPICDWEPDGRPHWECTCGCVWNTFDTSAKCPKCNKVWEDTQCPGPGGPGGCGRWSKHIDWYRNLTDEIRREMAKIFEKANV